MASLPAFPLFTQLPTELRLKIYILSLSLPRVVPLNYLSPTSDPRRHSHTELHGCTSTASLPALLHTSQESRALAQEYYSLSFNLEGPQSMFPPKTWFSTSKGADDILYFGPQPGYLGSFKHFVNVMMLLDPTELLKVRRLAVHEELFTQIKRERGPMDWNPNASRSKEALMDRCLRDFWDYVRRKFKNVEEVCVVASGMEEMILDMGFSHTAGHQVFFGMAQQPARHKIQENLHDRVARAIARLEGVDQHWVAPRWRVLSDVPSFENPSFGHQVRNSVGKDRRARRASLKGRVRRVSSDDKHLSEKMQFIIDDQKIDLDVDVPMY